MSACWDHTTRTVCKAASLLLQYPDRQVFELLEACAAAVRQLPEGAAREEFHRLIDHLQGTAPLRLQEHYTAFFDLSSATTPALTYHRWGEDKQRGTALAELNRRYREAGYEVSTAELPDYLPLVLEFLAIGPAADCSAIVAEYGGVVALLAGRLREADSPYGEMMTAVADLLTHERREP